MGCEVGYTYKRVPQHCESQLGTQNYSKSPIITPSHPVKDETLELQQNQYRTPVTHTQPGAWGKRETSSGLQSATSLLACEHVVLSGGIVEGSLYKTHKRLSLLSMADVLP